MPDKPIVIIGSINMDLVCRVESMPAPGQTILGKDFVTIPGGKGANQAVAAAKLSRDSEVHMIGRVGNDDFGQRLLNGLAQHKVNTRYVTITEGAATGIAMILVDKKGENSIVVSSGANHHVMPSDIDAAQDLIRSASAVVLQLELPLATVAHAIALCSRLGVYTILDPAPAPQKGLPREFYDVDLFTPNQSEAELLLSLKGLRHVKSKRAIEPRQIASDLMAKGPGSVVLKMGARGALSLSESPPEKTKEQIHPRLRSSESAFQRISNFKFQMIKSFKVKVVDTTAAGDAFTGALAVARAEGMPLKESVRFANAAGALACTAFGAQPALPTRDAVNLLLRTANHK